MRPDDDRAVGPMTSSTFDRWLLGAGAVIAVLIMAVALTFYNTRQLNEDAIWVAHTHEVMDTLEKANGHLYEAEAVQRTYLITGGSAIPPDFDAALDAAKQKIGRIKV